MHKILYSLGLAMSFTCASALASDQNPEVPTQQQHTIQRQNADSYRPSFSYVMPAEEGICNKIPNCKLSVYTIVQQFLHINIGNPDGPYYRFSLGEPDKSRLGDMEVSFERFVRNISLETLALIVPLEDCQKTLHRTLCGIAGTCKTLYRAVYNDRQYREELLVKAIKGQETLSDNEEIILTNGLLKLLSTDNQKKYSKLAGDLLPNDELNQTIQNTFLPQIIEKLKEKYDDTKEYYKYCSGLNFCLPKFGPSGDPISDTLDPVTSAHEDFEFIDRFLRIKII